jgi:hypothetical protein
MCWFRRSKLLAATATSFDSSMYPARKSPACPLGQHGRTRIGVPHITLWEKIAVVTNKEWLRHSVNIFGYLIPGEIKAYTTSDEGDARAWLAT